MEGTPRPMFDLAPSSIHIRAHAAEQAKPIARSSIMPRSNNALITTMDSTTQSGDADLRDEYAALRERAVMLEENVPPLLQRISDVLPRISGESELADEHRERLVGARNAAMVSIENYQQAIPFLQTADSIIEQLDKTPERDEDVEWRESLLQRLDELIDVAVVMIDDAQTYYEQADACDLSSVPKSILED
jgi:uncharacterized protein (DUF3084 family)